LADRIQLEGGLGALGLIPLACAGLAALVLLLAPAPARATNAITGGCTATPTGIVLPNYDLIAKTQQTSTGTISVKCTGTGTDTVNVALSTGSGTCATRKMVSGANNLTYNIYTTAGFATVWCDPTTRVSMIFTFPSQTTPSALTNPVTMFAKVPSAQSVATGSYSDTVGASVFWTGGNSAVSNFTVTESAPATCSASVGSLGFGTYIGALSTAQATLSVTCTSGTAYTLALSSGSNFSVTRRMKSAAGQFIGYALYKDSAFTNAWGDGTTAGTTASGSGNGSAQTFTVFGRAPAAAIPNPGSYSDAVVVTVTY
jgi:spore coat protein U-like protein